jgi:putative ATP-dependent endonuclease of OLD family
LKKDTGLALSSDEFAIEYLSSGNDFESEMLALGLRDELIDALVLSETKGSTNTRYVAPKRRKIAALTDPDLLVRLRASKASYAGFLGDIIRTNPYRRTKEALVPLSVRNGFTIIENWLT